MKSFRRIFFCRAVGSCVHGTKDFKKNFTKSNNQTTIIRAITHFFMGRIVCLK
ncbi:hypothetical protein AB205_0144340 [Aquarana catesbeiana]|uniref:Uncharacterized protein n=1 Tax=Aquarana catesbeiana TaxID=8400 RepID=A0A2G9QFX6_AQUCT|nr:hypothetical protein AB205_0144340 [Aquarana catesbeiana]